MTTAMSGRIPRLETKPRQKHAGRLSNLRAPHPARLPNPKPTIINWPDSRYERGKTGGQVTLYARLEKAGYFYAIRLPANNVLREKIAQRLTRPVGRPSLTKVKRFFEDFHYQAQSWEDECRVITKIEWHSGELFPRVGFIVTNLPMEPDWVVRFYNQRGTSEQHIKEGKYAFR